jgi:hypothetical protein
MEWREKISTKKLIITLGKKERKKMSSKLKVTFIDNASKQYDANASLIVTDGGKLYLGDRSSASFLQLKSRSCKSVVNADKSTHGLSKEDDVNYLNIDSYGKQEDIKLNNIESHYNCDHFFRQVKVVMTTLI